MDYGCSLVGHSLPSMCRALGPILAHDNQICMYFREDSVACLNGRACRN